METMFWGCNCFEVDVFCFFLAFAEHFLHGFLENRGPDFFHLTSLSSDSEFSVLLWFIFTYSCHYFSGECLTQYETEEVAFFLSHELYILEVWIQRSPIFSRIFRPITHLFKVICLKRIGTLWIAPCHLLITTCLAVAVLRCWTPRSPPDRKMAGNSSQKISLRRHLIVIEGY